MAKSRFLIVLTVLLGALHLVQPNRVLQHFLNIHGNSVSISESQMSRDLLLRKIDDAETEEDIFVLAEQVS